MRTLQKGFVVTALVTAAATPGWEADSATVYNSGPLILAFLGLCALVVLAQFAPVAMLLTGLIKGVAELLHKARVVPQRERDR